MKTKLAWLMMTGVLLAGCVGPRIDWNARIGSYTYDQAVIDYGPPDKQAKLTDGRKVLEWISRYSNNTSTAIISGSWGYPSGVGIVQTMGPQYYEDVLRLTFTTNNVLSAWSRN